jgi:RNA polymerase sigma-70 factor (ECF subfamily)
MLPPIDSTAPSPYKHTNPASKVNAELDAALVKRFLGGEEAAFIEIMNRYQSKIFAVANSFLHNRGDAEEITQDTFIRAHRCLHKFRGDSSLATWLHRIASNLSKNRYWYFFRRRRHSTLSLDCSIGEEGDSKLADLFTNGEATPAQENCRTEFAELIERCMESLDVNHREILELRNTRNLGYEEIGQKLGIQTGTVKSRIARARGQLRRRMAEACPEFDASAQPGDWLDPVRRIGRSIQASV